MSLGGALRDRRGVCRPLQLSAFRSAAPRDPRLKVVEQRNRAVFLMFVCGIARMKIHVPRTLLLRLEPPGLINDALGILR